MAKRCENNRHWLRRRADEERKGREGRENEHSHRREVTESAQKMRVTPLMSPHHPRIVRRWTGTLLSHGVNIPTQPQRLAAFRSSVHRTSSSPRPTSRSVPSAQRQRLPPLQPHSLIVPRLPTANPPDSSSQVWARARLLLRRKTGKCGMAMMIG
jgi:hypothetical protein